ncbi:hypothetical protein FPT15_27890 [Pseudomonas sp. RGB]|nr:hypothetical protein FPT15_27890 [Pseudomonas sp. RGB]
MGAGLLANAVCQSTNLPTDTPPSRASPLPQLKGVACFICDPTTGFAHCRIHARPRTPQIKGGSWLACDCSVSAKELSLIHRYRRQARSHS